MISIDSLHDTPLNCSLKNPLALVRAKVHVGCMYALDVYSLPLLRYICVENSASIALLKKKKKIWHAQANPELPCCIGYWTESAGFHPSGT